MCVRSVKIKHPPRLLGQRRRRSAKEMSAMVARNAMFKQPSRPTLQQEVLCEPSLSPILPDGDHSTGPSTSKRTIPPGRCSFHWLTPQLTVPSGRWLTPRDLLYTRLIHPLIPLPLLPPTVVRLHVFAIVDGIAMRVPNGSHRGEERSPRYTCHRGWHGQPSTVEHLHV